MSADPDRSLHILQVSTSDIDGGAEKVAWDLFRVYRDRGYTSALAVGRKRSDDPDVLEIPRLRRSVPWARPCWILHGRLAPLEGHVRGIWRLRHWLRTLAGGWPEIDRERGREHFHFPGSRRLLHLPLGRPNIVHAHNLHGGYFDLRFLPQLSQQVPVVLTLHDAWLLSGHCAHSINCERWRTGCGQCPDLSIYPAIRRDATAHNWRRKRDIYRHSRLCIATPSAWLMDKVQQSMLASAIVEARVIPNGIDLSLFRPGSQPRARAKLGLPQDVDTLLFAANSARRNVWKDYATLREALARVAETQEKKQTLLLALGEDAPTERLGRAEIRFIPYQEDAKVVASYYQAADVYIHAARAESWGLTITEALACGTPVVATAVGGISEQIDDGLNGFLTPPGNSEVMADRMVKLLTDHDLRGRMGAQATEIAQRRFDLNRQADEYLAWYQEILIRNPRSAFRNRRLNHALPDPE